MSEEPLSERAAEAVHDEALPEPPPSETDELLEDAKRRRRRGLIAVGGVLVVAAAGAATGLFAMQRASERRVAEGYGALSRCLWGEALPEGQSPGMRVRAAQLLMMTVPENKRAEAGASPWPMRCSTHALALKERLTESGAASGEGKGLADVAVELGEALKTAKSVYGPLAPMIDRLVEQAERSRVAAAAPPERVPDPPAGPTPLTLDDLEKAGPLSKKPVALKSVSAEFTTDGELRLLFRESDRGPLLCSVGKTATCRLLPEAIHASAAALRFAGTVEDGKAPIVLGERNGKGGVFRSDDGKKFETDSVYGARSGKDGVTLVGFDDAKDKILVSRFAEAGEKVEERIDPGGNTGNGYYNLGLLWDQLVWKAVKDDRIHMFARELRPSGDLLGPQADLGMINEPSMVENKEDEEPHVTGCRTKDALVARVKGWQNQFLLFRTAGQWSFPVKVAGKGGLLTCRGSEATLTWISQRIVVGAGRVIQERCTAAGCKGAFVKSDALVGGVREMAPADAAQTIAADLDGKMLFAWIAGEGGGLRMKLAPIEKMAETPDAVLFDPFMQKGKLAASSALYDMRLYVRSGVGVALLNTPSGVFAVTIGADGKFAPIPAAK